MSRALSLLRRRSSSAQAWHVQRGHPAVSRLPPSGDGLRPRGMSPEAPRLWQMSGAM